MDLPRVLPAHLTAIRSKAMPTVIRWIYHGGDDNAGGGASPQQRAKAARRGEEQRACAGDKVDDDILFAVRPDRPDLALSLYRIVC